MNIASPACEEQVEYVTPKAEWKPLHECPFVERHINWLEFLGMLDDLVDQASATHPLLGAEEQRLYLRKMFLLTDLRTGERVVSIYKACSYSVGFIWLFEPEIAPEFEADPAASVLSLLKGWLPIAMRNIQQIASANSKGTKRVGELEFEGVQDTRQSDCSPKHAPSEFRSKSVFLARLRIAAYQCVLQWLLFPSSYLRTEHCWGFQGRALGDSRLCNGPREADHTQYCLQRKESLSLRLACGLGRHTCHLCLPKPHELQAACTDLVSREQPTQKQIYHHDTAPLFGSSHSNYAHWLKPGESQL